MEFILTLLRSLCVSGRLKGTRCLAYAIFLVVEDENKIFCLSKVVYPEVAKKYGTTATAVERNIRTAIKICWERGGAERLRKILAYAPEERPTSSEMIDLLSDYVRKSLR